MLTIMVKAFFVTIELATAALEFMKAKREAFAVYRKKKKKRWGHRA